MKKAFLLRLKDDGTRTLGRFFLFNNTEPIFMGATLELPWKNNEFQQSCIPPGIYQATLRESEKFGEHFILKDVPGRSMILIHPGNFPENTQGCILLGMTLSDINGDGKQETSNSKMALKSLVSKASEGFTLEISSNPK